jgi:titin
MAVSGIGTVHLAWNPPQDDGGHDVSGYWLYRRVDGGAMVLWAKLGPGTTEVDDADVDVGQVYTYRVTAVTDAGESIGGEVATAKPIGPPGEPLSLVAHWMDGYVQLTWSAPLDDGSSPITGYRLFRHDRKEGNWTELTALELSISDEDVEVGRTYNYTVWAINAAGSGPGRVVSHTVPVPPPEPPESSGSGMWLLLAVVILMGVLAASLLITSELRRRSGRDL